MLLNRTCAVMFFNRAGGVVWVLKPLPLCIIHICTYDLYGPVRNVFDGGSIHYLGKWEGDGLWIS
jgi:hypothetical protein